MKKILLILLSFHLSLCVAGDGTLPVIRDIQIDFLDNGPGRNIQLPKCVVVNINTKLKNQDSLTKKISLKKANLKQTIKVANRNGDIVVRLNSHLLNNNIPVRSIRRDLNSFEFMNELNLMDQTLVQHIQINPEFKGSCVRK